MTKPNWTDFTYNWNLDDADYQKFIRTGELISPKYPMMDTHVWQLKLCRISTFERCALRMILLKPSPPITVSFSILVLGHQELATQKTHVRFEGGSFRQSRVFNPVTAHMPTKFEVTIACSAKELEALEAQGVSNHRDSKVFSDLNEFDDDTDPKDSSDFLIVAMDGEEMKCKKELLATASPVFRTMLSMNMRESREGKVNIDDFHGATIRHMLAFMRNGEFSVSSEHTMFELVTLADKYELDALKLQCENWFLDGMTEENALKVLLIAFTYRMERLQVTSPMFVVRHWPQVRNHTDREILFADSKARDAVFNLLGPVQGL